MRGGGICLLFIINLVLIYCRLSNKLEIKGVLILLKCSNHDMIDMMRNYHNLPI